MDSALISYLNQFGLSSDEAVIYLKLLEIGPSTVLKLAQECNLKRATTHIKVEDLIQKGLITQTKRGARRMVVAEVPEKFQSLIDQKLWELKRLENHLPEIIDKIYGTIPKVKSSTHVDVKYYEGKVAVRLVYKEILKSTEIRSYVDSIEVNKIFPENFDLFSKALQNNKSMKMWEIIKRPPHIDDYISKMDPKRYAYKFAEKINLSVIDYLIYDGHVAIVNIKEDATAIVISNQDYYENARAIFDFMWQMMPD